MTSIRARLLMVLLPGLALVLVIGGAAVYWIARAGLMRQVDSALEARVHALAALVKLEPGGLTFEVNDVSPAMLGETWFELRKASGDLLYRSENLAQMSLPQRERGQEDRLVIDDVALPGGVHGRAAWLALRPRVDADDWAGFQAQPAEREPLIIAAAIDRHPLDQALATLRQTLLVVGSGVGAITILLAAAGVRWGLAPLDRLSRQLAGVGGESISQRVDQRGAPRELKPVYRELNGMLDRVEQTIERERSFADAAAHELRTPLAELRSAAEVALRWPDAKPPAAALNEALAISAEMERLVESLLHIGRTNGQLHGEMSGESVQRLVQRCVDGVRETVQSKRLHVAAELPEAGTFPASGEALEIIMRNLIANAAEYTPVAGSILVRAERDDAGSQALVVENGPVALPARDLPRLFEPFWRADPAHASREHVGLGLAVVDRLAQASGLSVRASLADGRLRIRVSTA